MVVEIQHGGERVARGGQVGNHPRLVVHFHRGVRLLACARALELAVDDAPGPPAVVVERVLERRARHGTVDNRPLDRFPRERIHTLRLTVASLVLIWCERAAAAAPPEWRELPTIGRRRERVRRSAPPWRGRTHPRARPRPSRRAIAAIARREMTAVPRCARPNRRTPRGIPLAPRRRSATSRGSRRRWRIPCSRHRGRTRRPPYRTAHATPRRAVAFRRRSVPAAERLCPRGCGGVW